MGYLIKSKLMESFRSILPIALIVATLSFTLTPMDTSTFLLFVFGAVCLMIGLSFFTMGAEMSMQTIGTKLGSYLAKSGKVWLISFVSFIIGVLVTISEPDLQILANQVAVPNMVLILTVSAGVGLFLLIGMLRIVFKISLSVLLIGFYIIAFVLCCFVSPDFWALAFDSGGVTTGPMTVPFIMAIGAGVARMRSSGEGHDDAFGLVSLCSVGPILAVMILGICYSLNGGADVGLDSFVVNDTRHLMGHYVDGFLSHAQEIAVALAPILVFTLLFQLLTRSFGKGQLLRIGMGFLYTFIGLVVFLTGANEGFMPIGQALGQSLASLGNGWVLLP
ncbi:MAG: DUF1538 family protein, partial [Clostridia bacterium]|nr:DUF1538 family protein [Clostridia bacterium]